MPRTNTLKRQELYQRVWREPMVQLAKAFAMSDVGLAKVCRKHDIPRPPRGYWAKVQNGQKLQRTPLPDAENNASIEMRDPADAPVRPADLEGLDPVKVE